MLELLEPIIAYFVAIYNADKRPEARKLSQSVRGYSVRT